MAASVFEHQEDQGKLSVFAAGDTVVVSCENGHYWVIGAQQESRDTVRSALEGLLSEEQADLIMGER